jgi:hypothetical protein
LLSPAQLFLIGWSMPVCLPTAESSPRYALPVEGPAACMDSPRSTAQALSSPAMDLPECSSAPLPVMWEHPHFGFFPILLPFPGPLQTGHRMGFPCWLEPYFNVILLELFFLCSNRKIARIEKVKKLDAYEFFLLIRGKWDGRGWHSFYSLLNALA